MKFSVIGRKVNILFAVMLVLSGLVMGVWRCNANPVKVPGSGGHKAVKKIYDHIVWKFTFDAGKRGSYTSLVNKWTPAPPPAGAKEIGSNPIHKSMQQGHLRITIVGRIENWQ
jgi:hypothetical protein